jgi:hypothetical protein
MRSRHATLLLIALLALPVPAHADLLTKAASESVKFMMKKFGKEVAEEGAERLAGRLLKAASRHGDDIFSAARKVGPKAIHLADAAGDKAPGVLRLLTRHGDTAVHVLGRPECMKLYLRYGDDAALAMMKHRGIAEPLIEKLGEPAVKALASLGPQAGRRLVMMGGASEGMLGVLSRHGDAAMEFVWKHKAVLAGSAALTAFLADPKPYLDGTRELVATAAEVTVKPAAQAVGHVAGEAFGFLRWALTILVVALSLGVYAVVKSGVHKNPLVRCVVKSGSRRILESVFKQR